MGCVSSRQFKRSAQHEDLAILAKETTFSVSEVEALYELSKKDKLFHNQRWSHPQGRVPASSIQEQQQEEPFRQSAAFRLYDLIGTGCIEREELHEMVLAILHESDLFLSEEAVEQIVDQTFKQADLNGDGKIDPDEWKMFASKNLALLKNMTLPYLKDITIVFPRFVLNSQVGEEEL